MRCRTAYASRASGSQKAAGIEKLNLGRSPQTGSKRLSAQLSEKQGLLEKFDFR